MLRFKFTDRIPASFRNKYLLTILLFLIWIILLDSNNLISRFKDMRELSRLKTDREYYLNKIEEDSRKLRELKTDNRKPLLKRPDAFLVCPYEKEEKCPAFQ